jgi:hypothetical protein
MISLTNTSDFVLVFTMAAIAGLIGGFAAELLLSRDGETGTFELPARKGAFFDLGGFAPLFVGAVVGVAILIVFPPETTIVSNAANGTTTSIRGYDAVRLIATSLVAGSAGGSVLSSLQARVTAAVNESRVQLTAAAGEQQLEQLRETATAEARDQIRAVVNAVAGVAPAGGSRSRGVLSEAPADANAAATRDAVAEEAIAAFEATLSQRTDQGRSAINAAAGGTRGR